MTKIFLFIICFTVFVVAAAFAGGMTWSTTNPDANTHEGYNTVLHQQNLAVGEVRSNVDAFKNAFDAYTSLHKI